MNEDTPSTDVKPHCPTDKEYVDIIRSDMEVDKTFTEAAGQPAKITYYCKECRKTVTPKRIGKKLSFRCGECGKETISFGTESSIANYYNIK